MKEHAAWFRDAPIRGASAGLRCEGFFVQPLCEPECCRPVGPFPDEASARDWSRRMAAAQEAGDGAAIIELSVEADLLRDDP
jgi:hypothetical protein